MSAAEPKEYRESFLAELYDATPFVAGRADVNFYRESAARAGDPILELGCGTGRILPPLAEAGHRVWGLDLSPVMLERRRKNCKPNRKLCSRACVWSKPTWPAFRWARNSG